MTSTVFLIHFYDQSTVFGTLILICYVESIAILYITLLIPATGPNSKYGTYFLLIVTFKFPKCDITCDHYRVSFFIYFTYTLYPIQYLLPNNSYLFHHISQKFPRGSCCTSSATGGSPIRCLRKKSKNRPTSSILSPANWL